MSARIGTKYKFRHYRPGEDGISRLLWASDGPEGSIYARKGEEIVKGSRMDLEVTQDQLWSPNALMDEGEDDMLDVYFGAQAVRANTYFRLFADGAIAETDTLALLTNEVTGTGYAGIAVARGTDWTGPTLDTGDMQVDSVTKSFTAGGAWTAADELVLATVVSGTAGLALAWVALSATRTLTNGDQLDVSLNVKLA